MHRFRRGDVVHSSILFSFGDSLGLSKVKVAVEVLPGVGVDHTADFHLALPELLALITRCDNGGDLHRLNQCRFSVKREDLLGFSSYGVCIQLDSFIRLEVP